MATIDIKLKSYDELMFEITTLNTDKYLLQQRIDKAILEIKNEIEMYDGSNEDLMTTEWVEMKIEDYIEKLQSFLKILGDKK